MRRPAATISHRFSLRQLTVLAIFILLSIGTASATPPPGKGEALSFDISAPESVVQKAVEEVADDKVVHGTYVYEKDKAPPEAHRVEQSNILPVSGTGKNYFKVAEGVIAPRFFKDTQDIGSITVRYAVQSISSGSTRVYINAVFVEDGRRENHESTGVVENSEFEAIQQHLQKILADHAPKPAPQPEASLSPAQPIPARAVPLPAADNSAAEKQLEERLEQLRHQVELRAKAPTPLRSAPFQSATTLLTVPANSEVLVLVITPYWYGVETSDGRHGWIHKSRLEPLP